MISIFALIDKQETIQKLINAEYRLNELVSFTLNMDEADIVIHDFIQVNPDWRNTQPPILFSTIAFTENIFMGYLFARLSNYEKAYPLLREYPQLLNQVELLNKIQHGIEIKSIEKFPTDYIGYHNKAITLQYGHMSDSVEFNVIQETFESALNFAPDAHFKAYTAWHFTQCLNDVGIIDEAEIIIQGALNTKLSEQSIISLKNVLCQLWMKKLTVPYDKILLDKLKNTLWECLTYSEKHHYTAESGLLLKDAAHIASISHSFSEALGYINKAINLFEEDRLPELCAEAQLMRGNILQLWAQNGNPQFYRQAVQSYQHALKVFSKTTAPDIFAEIQHQLGKVYAEIPDEIKKKSVWAAISVSSFTEALTFYNHQDHPYEYAMICNNLGNAYTKYPSSVKSDNYEIALEWYTQALNVRTAVEYPIERVLSLANYLEASWYARNYNEFSEGRYNDMISKAKEIIKLSQNADIVANAKEDIKKLKLLRQEFISIVSN